MWSFVNTLLSPRKFFSFSSRLLPWLSVACLLLLGYGLVGALWLAPADAVQGEGFRILYVHAPSAFLSLFIYAMMAGAAAASLVWRLKMASLVIKHSAPLGACFTFLALLTGSLWGKPMWGTWWIWDARLTSELILLFMYIGILLLISAISTKKRGERAIAIFVLVGFVDLPIIHYSVYWWNTLHQGATLKLFAPATIDASMLHPLMAMMAAFLLYYAIVLFMRMRYELTVVETRPHWLKEKTK
ncbi:MAG: heme ABC transporter permease [Gammaproteobacteria bacterium RIFCSPHIGHO2_12_FULL_45_12]|nr:MAG: heme ABC transporter permease [Gammaproteobacteria bacterium RIFCSPHIGHO2_12_FULL_45_12]